MLSLIASTERLSVFGIAQGARLQIDETCSPQIGDLVYLQYGKFYLIGLYFRSWVLHSERPIPISEVKILGVVRPAASN